MNHQIELLAPGGDIKAMKTAIYAGANAIYCGLNKFNARNRAANISFDDLLGILRIAHEHDCQVFLTLNIVILESEIPALVKLLNRLVNTSIDGVIVQDFGLLYLLNHHFPTLNIHASTQMNTHNAGQIHFLKQLKVERVNLSRELNIHEIGEITAIAHKEDVAVEVFVHGSYCISFSGQCYMSSLQSGNSGNKGQCSQPCRDMYVTTAVGNEYPLNMKDNSAFLDLEELYNARVDSLKIEGRIKEFEYVYTIVDAWRKQVDRLMNKETLSIDKSDLYKVFNRDFSNGFLQGTIDKKMFINNPMNYSLDHLTEVYKADSVLELDRKRQALLNEKLATRTRIEHAIAGFNVDKLPLTIRVTGHEGLALCLSVSTPDNRFEIHSKALLSGMGTEALDKAVLLKRLKAVDDTAYFIEDIQFDLSGGVYIPFKELTYLKKQLLYVLNGNRPLIPQVSLSLAKKNVKTHDTPLLSIIISSLDDLEGIEETNCTVFYQLPNQLREDVDYVALFAQNAWLVPIFPAILIGEDYCNALALLDCIDCRLIVANNTGIAYEAFKRGIDWVAGAQLNITNSYSLLLLKERFNCKGAFLSNELSKMQLSMIKKTEGFDLYYTVFQPTILMTSRQCFFHQVGGCAKHVIDNTCISHCEKHDRITNAKGEPFIIEKCKDCFHRMYNASHVFNDRIALDMGDRFKSLVVDLSQVADDTRVSVGSNELISLFEQHIARDEMVSEKLHSVISTTNNSQYEVGI